MSLHLLAPMKQRIAKINRVLLYLFACGSLSGSVLFDFDPIEIERKIRSANDYFIEYFDYRELTYPWWWDRATYFTGNTEAAKLLAEERYWNHSLEWSIHNNWSSGIWNNRWRHPLHADALLAHQTYIDLYRRNPSPHKVAAAIERMNDLINNVPWDDPGGTDPNNSVDDWWWIDAYFMAAPMIAQVANLQESEIYRNHLRRMYDYMKITRNLFCETHGLWFRDESQFPELRLSPNGEPVFWSRGNGWVFAGHARVLDEMPADHPDREEYIGNFIKMAHALVPLQQADGFWRSNLLDPSHFPGPETSGTAFFTAGIAWGIRHGFLSQDLFYPVLEAAWLGLTRDALKPGGRVGFVQNVGLDPQPAGADETHDFGVGAFLLAGTEILKLIGGPAPVYPFAGPDRFVVKEPGSTQFFLRLNAWQSPVRVGRIEGASWWTGNVFLGEGMTPQLILPQGRHSITLQLRMDDGMAYENSMNVTVAEKRNVVSVSASSAQIPNIPENTLDGDLDSRWSAFGDGEWIQFELETPASVDTVAMAFYLGDTRQAEFSLDVSRDGERWDSVFENHSSSGYTIDPEFFHFEPMDDVRFVRIIGHGNTESDWNSITQVGFFSSIPVLDRDGNGLPDAWEMYWFGQTGQDPLEDVNQSGRSNLAEYIAGTNPFTAEELDPVALHIGICPDTGELEARFFAIAAFGPGYHDQTRYYEIQSTDNLYDQDWQPLHGFQKIEGNNLSQRIPLPIPDSDKNLFFRKIITLSHGE